MSIETIEQPTIYTTEGNLPLADLEHRFYWQDETGRKVDGLTDHTQTLFFVEEYWREGRMVKRSANGIQRAGVIADTAIGTVS